MKWFGRSWGARVCDPADHVATPGGTPCPSCKEPIAEDDQGLVVPHVEIAMAVAERPWHLGCFLASIGLEAIPPQQEEIIHVLRHGRSLCGMPGVPKDWPQGHRWVRLEEAHLATCRSCTVHAGCL